METKHMLYAEKSYFPLKISIIYISITVILSIVGPIKYFGDGYKYWLVLPYMVGVCLCLSFGYYLGNKTKEKVRRYVGDKVIRKREERLLRWSLSLSIISLLIELIYVISIGHFSLSLDSLGELYNTIIEDKVNAALFIRFLCSAFRLIAICLGMYKYRMSSIHTKRLIIFNIFLYLLVFLFGYGNQKGVSDIIIYFALSLYIVRLKAAKIASKKSIRVIVVVLIVSILLFSYMQYLRFEPMGINANNYHLFSTGEYYYDTNHIIFKIFGDKLGFGLASIMAGYLSQGYYGLSLCMQLPFKWTYGLGSSYALTSILKKVGVTGIYEQTYLNRMTERFRRSGLQSWNTIFPWLASDYTWIGAMLLFTIVGYFMAKSWKEVILHDNVISYVVFACIVIVIVFIPANNQIFHGYDSFISTWVMFILWLFKRGNYMHE